MTQKKQMVIEVEMPSGVSATFAHPTLTVKGKAGEVVKSFNNPRIALKVDGNKIVLTALRNTQVEKMHINTFAAHVRNMVKGAQELFVYELKICSGHFPMTAAIKGTTFELKNFLGEHKPRSLTLKAGAKVTVSGAIIKVESADIELAGRVTSDLEQLTRIADKDRRVFQDGIYLVKKMGNPI